MYTSLMTYASRLAEQESRKTHKVEDFLDRSADDDGETISITNIGENVGATNTISPWPSLEESFILQRSNGKNNQNHKDFSTKDQDTKAVDIYSEIMSTLIATSRNSKVSATTKVNCITTKRTKSSTAQNT